MTFANITREPTDDWIGTGIAETVSSDLKNIIFIQREDEIAGAGVHQEIRVLDALRDAFVGEKFADVVT